MTETKIISLKGTIQAYEQKYGSLADEFEKLGIETY
jgi:hypothetical protein